MSAQTPITIDDLERVEKGFTRLIERTCSILIFDSSHLKCQASLRSLKADGFQNVITSEKIANIDILLGAHKFRLVILDGDMKENESLKFFIELKQKKIENMPAVIFMREAVTDKILELYKRAGAVGCIKRPVIAEELEVILAEIFHFDIALENNYSLEIKDFGESTLVRVRGTLTENNLPEFLLKISTDLVINKSLILDFSKIKKVHEHLRRVLLQTAETLSASQKKLELYDPRHKLSHFEMENFSNIYFL